MRLHWKPPIGCLYPEVAANPHDFFGHRCLILTSAQVFNHRIAEHDVNALVGKITKICGIADS